jgi:hypothetical protein
MVIQWPTIKCGTQRKLIIIEKRQRNVVLTEPPSVQNSYGVSTIESVLSMIQIHYHFLCKLLGMILLI